MRYIGVALDYDGTIARDGVVPARVFQGLQKLKASGRKLLLVTGRELEELLGIFPGIGIFDRVVAENGALLFRPENGERRELGTPPPPALVSALKASGIPLTVGHTILATVRPYEGVVLECIANLGLEQQLIFNKGAVMVLPPGCNKASGLKFALTELGLSPRNLVAAGDGENDHALLDLAEYSVATQNAVPMLKEAADRVTDATHGDGVLEIVAGLLDSDLGNLPARRHRRAIVLGKDVGGVDWVLPASPCSIVVAGTARDTLGLTGALRHQLSAAGYQSCVLATHDGYLGMQHAVAFGTLQTPPALDEILTALEQPDVQMVIDLEALPDTGRVGFAREVLALLHRVRAQTARPHWLFIDQAHDLLSGGDEGADMLRKSADGLVFVTSVPLKLETELLTRMDSVVACGARAGAILGELAQKAGWDKPAIPPPLGSEHTVLAWSPRGGQSATPVRELLPST